jgi:cytochrome b subunit of formate dehydrogenase
MKPKLMMLWFFIEFHVETHDQPQKNWPQKKTQNWKNPQKTSDKKKSNVKNKFASIAQKHPHFGK